MSITATIHRIEQALTREHAAAESPLTPRQLLALEFVSKNDGCSQTDIVDGTGIDRSTLADLVRRLVKTGLVARRRDRNDARAYVLRITDEGSRALAKAQAARKKAEAKVIQEFPILRGLAA